MQVYTRNLIEDLDLWYFITLQLISETCMLYFEKDKTASDDTALL